MRLCFLLLDSTFANVFRVCASRVSGYSCGGGLGVQARSVHRFLIHRISRAPMFSTSIFEFIVDDEYLQWVEKEQAHALRVMFQRRNIHTL